MNDEAPFFVPTSLYTDYVAEDAQGNTPILYVQAQDPDRDQVKYSFIDVAGSPTTVKGHFEIDPDTGRIIFARFHSLSFTFLFVFGTFFRADKT